MFQVTHGPLISQPEQWLLAFDPHTENRLARAVPGRFKHVRAFGYVPFLHVWLFLDPTFAGIEVWVAAKGEAADAMAAQWTRGCTVVLMPRRPHANQALALAASGWCVPVVKRLIGLQSGALRVDALFGDCLRQGGRLYGQQLSRTSDDDADHGQQRAGNAWRRLAHKLAGYDRGWHSGRADAANIHAAGHAFASCAAEPDAAHLHRADA